MTHEHKIPETVVAAAIRAHNESDDNYMGKWHAGIQAALSMLLGEPVATMDIGGTDSGFDWGVGPTSEGLELPAGSYPLYALKDQQP